MTSQSDQHKLKQSVNDLFFNSQQLYCFRQCTKYSGQCWQLYCYIKDQTSWAKYIVFEKFWIKKRRASQNDCVYMGACVCGKVWFKRSVRHTQRLKSEWPMDWLMRVEKVLLGAEFYHWSAFPESCVTVVVLVCFEKTLKVRFLPLQVFVPGSCSQSPRKGRW